MRIFRPRRRSPATCIQPPLPAPAAPLAPSLERAWFEATYSRRSDWHRVPRWERVGR